MPRLDNACRNLSELPKLKISYIIEKYICEGFFLKANSMFRKILLEFKRTIFSCNIVYTETHVFDEEVISFILGHFSGTFVYLS